MALSNLTIRKAKPKAKPYKLADEKGLFLLVQPSGGLLWRLKYRVEGFAADGKPKRIEKKLGLGTYPDVGLKEAREARDEARKLIAARIDPAEKVKEDRLEKQAKASNTFGGIAEQYLAKVEREGKAVRTIAKLRWQIGLLSPQFQQMPIADIEPRHVLTAIKPIEAKGILETARRTLNLVGQVFRYAVALQLAPSDQSRDLKGAFMAPQRKHMAAIVEPKQASELLRAIQGYEGHYVTLYALRMAPHVFVRPGELRMAEWSEFDLDKAVWEIPAGKMKARQPHFVPLSA
jgi:hypothetical protein